MERGPRVFYTSTLHTPHLSWNMCKYLVSFHGEPLRRRRLYGGWHLHKGLTENLVGSAPTPFYKRG
jgi:hypothetical protein